MYGKRKDVKVIIPTVTAFFFENIYISGVGRLSGVVHAVTATLGKDSIPLCAGIANASRRGEVSLVGNMPGRA